MERSLEEVLQDLAEVEAALQNERERIVELESDYHWMQLKLNEAAELMATVGKIHNTPHAKQMWARGR